MVVWFVIIAATLLPPFYLRQVYQLRFHFLVSVFFVVSALMFVGGSIAALIYEQPGYAVLSYLLFGLYSATLSGYIGLRAIRNRLPYARLIFGSFLVFGCMLIPQVLSGVFPLMPYAAMWLLPTDVGWILFMLILTWGVLHEAYQMRRREQKLQHELQLTEGKERHRR